MSGKKKTIIIVALLLVVFIGSISYALWSVTLEQTDSNIVKTGCFTVDMVEQTDEINLPEEYPVTDAEGRKYSPFTFTIQNTCTIDSSYSVNLKVEDGTTLEHQYVKAVLDGDKAQVLTAYEKATDEDKYQLTTGTLAGASAEGAGDGESVTYNLRLWLDADTPKTQMSKDFYAKIVIENITTSGAIKKEILATADISEAQDGSVVYTYYNTGELDITGTGRIGNVGPILNSIITLKSQDDSAFAKSLTEEEKDLINNALSYQYYPMVLNALSENYEAANLMFEMAFPDTCQTEITNYEEYSLCLKEISDELGDTMISLSDKINQYLPVVKTISISEGVSNLPSSFFGYAKSDELIMPSTLLEIGDGALALVSANIELNEGLQSMGYLGQIFTDSVLEIPNSVTEFDPGFSDLKNMAIKLPKNSTYYKINTYDFENVENLTLYIPETVTLVLYNAFYSAKNTTLNFECSEDNSPFEKGIQTVLGDNVTLNYNSDYDFGE